MTVDAQRFSGLIRAVVFEGDLLPERVPLLLDDTTLPEWARVAAVSSWTNLVTNVGRQQMTKLIVGETSLRAAYMGLSTTAIVPALADLALPNEKVRVALSVVQSFATYYQRYSAYFSTISFTSTGILAEGIFDAVSTGGSMYAEGSIAVSKSATQSLVIEHKIQATT